MTANSEFQAILKDGHIAEAISLVVSRLVELDIVTAVPPLDGSVGRNVLSTKVNLLSGLISNEVGVEFVQNQDYEKFLSFHTAQVGATSQMVREQIQGLQSLLGLPRNNTVPTSSSTVSKIAKIETPQASNDTMPVVAPAVEMRPISPEPPTIVSHSPAKEATASPDRDLIPLASESTADLDETTLEMETQAEIEDYFTPETPPTIIQVDRSAANQINPQPAPPVPPVTISASAMSAAIAQAGSPDPSEANTIPNKLDQAFRSAGVKSEEGVHPFDSEPVGKKAEVKKADPRYSAAKERLKEPDEPWDEWLEEDAILSELSQVSRAVTKEKIPDLHDSWFPKPPQGEDSPMDDWEKFIPEYTEPSSKANKGQANVERFRQNLVNDPQLMNELLAELDDIEHLGEGNSPQPPSKNGGKAP
jgi:hypothetical protein